MNIFNMGQFSPLDGSMVGVSQISNIEKQEKFLEENPNMLTPTTGSLGVNTQAIPHQASSLATTV